MITLYTFGPAFGLPDPSPFVTKVEVLLKMAGLAYRTDSTGFRRAPKGKLPYIDDDGEQVADSTFIRWHLENKHRVDFDKGLSAEQRAIAWRRWMTIAHAQNMFLNIFCGRAQSQRHPGEVQMKLYYFETPNGRKACAVARYLNAPVEFVRVDLAKGEHKAPAFLAINPNGKVPALEDGQVRLWESAAIMCYLADKAGSSLWPKDATRQIDAIRWLSWDAMHFSRHGGTLFFQRVVKPHFRLGEPDLAAIDEAMGFFRQFAGVLNSHLEGRGSVVGDGLTVADFALASFLPHAQEARIPLDEFPEIRRWYAQLEQLPAWREPFPTAAASAA